MLLSDINLRDDNGEKLISFDTPGEFLNKILKPCLDSELTSFEAASGYFSVASFRSLGQNLDNFFNKQAKLKVVIGIEDPDISVLQAVTGDSLPEEILEKYRKKLYDDASLIADEIEISQISVISFLILENLLEIKVAVKKNEEEDGIFHPKSYIFTDVEGNKLGASGSGNFTKGSFEANYENMNVFTSFDWGQEWLDLSSERNMQNSFNDLWENRKDGLDVFTLDKEFAQDLLDNLGNPTKENTLEILNKLKKRDISITDDEFYKLLHQSPIFNEFNLSTSGLYPHQINALKKSLSSWPVRILFADEVGLGKTLELGSLIAYMIKNKLIKNVLILAPAQLVLQWQEEMQIHFDLPFWALDAKSKEWKLSKYYQEKSGSISQKQDTPIKYSEKFPDFAIMSKTLASKRNNHIFTNFKTEGLPDLLVVDEAHWARQYMKPDKTLHKTLLRRMLEDVKEEMKHVAFATATPMRKQPDEYYYLLELLGLDSFLSDDEYNESFKIIAKGENNELNGLNKIATILTRVAELKEQVLKYSENLLLNEVKNNQSDKWLSENKKELLEEFIVNHPTRIFTSRNIQENLKKYPETYQIPERNLISSPISLDDMSPKLTNFFDILIDYVYSDYQKTEQAMSPGKKINIGLRKSQLEERFASSFWSAKKSLENRLEVLHETLKNLQNGIINLDIFEQPLGEINEEDEFEIEDNFDDVSPFNFENVISVAKKEIASVEERLERANILIDEKNSTKNVDPKINYVIDILEKHFKSKAAKPILIFSKYTDTLDEVEKEVIKHISEDGIPKYGYANYTGKKQNIYIPGFSSPQDVDKKKVTEYLKEEKIKIVFCSTAANEGLNLQSASAMINVDVPWVPSDLEQRIGRIARLGQKEKVVQIYNLWYPQSIESHMYSVLLSREKDMLGAVGPFPELISEGISSNRSVQSDLGKNTNKVIDNINKLRSSDNMKSLMKLWKVDEVERKPIGDIFRKDLQKLMLKAELNVDDVNIHAGDLDVLNFLHLDFHSLISLIDNTKSDIGNANLYGLITNEKLWGLSYKLDNGKSYLLDPMELPKILDSVLFTTIYEDNNKIEYEKSELTELLDRYVDYDFKILYPAHYRKVFSNNIDLPYSYKEDVEEILLSRININ